MLQSDGGSNSPKILPDIARESRVDLTGRLDRVGMTEIEVPIIISNDHGVKQITSGKATAFVSLDDPFAKGIHMSRLFLHLQELLNREVLSFKLIDEILRIFVSSHVEISESSYVSLEFDQMAQRPALKSQNLGWRSYPVTMSGGLEKGIPYFELGVRITYSSTCPCSAALARRLIQDHFRKSFKDAKVDTDRVYEWLGSTQGVIATPHSQRSYADIKVKFSDPLKAPKLLELVDLIENKLATPVQAAVKREDEQEFALLNGQNLMFCEDAARKIKNALSDKAFLQDFWVKVRHVESLHPHNAVAIATKGVKGGYKAEK